MRALTSLHVGRNHIPEKEMREIIAIALRMESMNILCEVPVKDKTLTELDISGKCLGYEGTLVVAEYLDGNGAITRLNLSDNGKGGHNDEPGVHALADMLKSNTTLKEFNISSNSLDKECAQILAPAIKDNGAILSVNLLKNSIGVDQAKDLVIILKEHPTLKSLCGNKGNETELDMSGKMGGAEDAIMLAAEVVDNGAGPYRG
jgi:hypothetical protein